MSFDLQIEQMPNNYAAFSREYPTIVVTGQSEEEVRRLFAEAVEIYEEEERKDAQRNAETEDLPRSGARIAQ